MNQLVTLVLRVIVDEGGRARAIVELVRPAQPDGPSGAAV